MKKERIKKLIDTLKAITDCIEEAYEVTYNETGQVFADEVNRRKQNNKKEFINQAKKFIKKKYQEETGDIMSEEIAEGFANDFFNVAMMRGDLDALNKLRKE